MSPRLTPSHELRALPVDLGGAALLNNLGSGLGLGLGLGLRPWLRLGQGRTPNPNPNPEPEPLTRTPNPNLTLTLTLSSLSPMPGRRMFQFFSAAGWEARLGVKLRG